MNMNTLLARKTLCCRYVYAVCFIIAVACSYAALCAAICRERAKMPVIFFFAFYAMLCFTQVYTFDVAAGYRLPPPPLRPDFATATRAAVFAMRGYAPRRAPPVVQRGSG